MNRKAGENKRRLDTDDLLHLYSILDVNKIALPMYVAANLARIPPSMRSTQPDIGNLQTTVSDLHSQVSVMKLQLESLCAVMLPCTSPTTVQRCDNTTGIATSYNVQDSAANIGIYTDVMMPTHEAGAESAHQLTNASTACQIPTWAQRAAAVVEAEDQFQTVSYRRRKPPLMVGRRTTECRIKTVPRRPTCFVGRLDINTSEEDLKVHLTEAGITGVRCTRVKAKSDQTFSTAAFRVSCDESAKNILYDESIWPVGVELRDWIFYPRNGVASS